MFQTSEPNIVCNFYNQPQFQNNDQSIDLGENEFLAMTVQEQQYDDVATKNNVYFRSLASDLCDHLLDKCIDSYEPKVVASLSDL